MFYNNYKCGITFKNCESLYYIPIIYIILYINYTSLKKKCSELSCGDGISSILGYSVGQIWLTSCLG